MKKILYPILLLTVITYAVQLDAQGVVKGQVKDKNDKASIEFATIALFLEKDSSLVTGTVTDKRGNFTLDNIPYGSYYLESSFVGYDKQKSENFVLSASNPLKNLVFELQPTAINMDHVEISAEAPVYMYKIDKKVINVSQDILSSGGTAVDALESAPSVETDLEGNVSLRGSSNFKVLIDGKPTILDGNDVLNTISASQIESIEIITNPSAKFDPDGTAGIINVIMKKNVSRDLQGLINVSGGTGPSYSGDITLSYQKKKIAVSANIDYGYRSMGITRNIDRYSFLNDTNSVLFTRRDGIRYRKNFSIRTGIDYNIMTNNTASIAVSYRNWGRGHDDEAELNEIVQAADVNDFYFTSSVDEIASDAIRIQVGDYHRFNNDGHEMSFNLMYSFDDENGFEISQKYLTASDFEINTGQLLTKTHRDEFEDENEIRLDLDYVFPHQRIGTFEAGYAWRLDDNTEKYQYESFDTANNTWIEDESYNMDYDFYHSIHAIYATWFKEFNKISAKAGMRMENTVRTIDPKASNLSYDYERFDVYPSFYLTYHFNKNQQIQLNYSKRVNRPRTWFLNPVPHISDGFNEFRGNPELEPEFAHSFEMNYMHTIGKFTYVFESYYRKVYNKMTRLSKMDDNGLLIFTIENLYEDESLGGEFMLKYALAKWWDINLTSTAYQYSLSGSYDDEDVVKESFNWNIQLRQTFKLGKKTQFQLDGMYNSPTVTVSGEREEFIFANAGLRRTFFNRSLIASFMVRDVFNSRHIKFTAEGDNYYTENEFFRQAPMFRFSLSYRFNNYKPENDNRDNGEGGNDDMFIF